MGRNGNRIDMTGKRFGYLRVIRFAGRHSSGNAMWTCVCKCGTKKDLMGVYLRSGNIKSCGCMRSQLIHWGKTAKLAGVKFGRLTVVRRCKAKGNTTSVWWVCRCECGNMSYHTTSDLNVKKRLSCGCYKKGPTSLLWKHGGSTIHKREHNSYISMKARCLDEKNISYEHYGARGIKICDRWLEPDGRGFIHFLSDMGPRPQGKTLDRKNVMGNYEPGNCRWASKEVQNANKRCNMTEEELAELSRAAAMEERLTADYYSGGEAAF